MKIIKVESCEECPYMKFNSSDCGRENFYCDHDKGFVLAREREIVVKEVIISPIDMTVTREQKKWTYVLPDEKTEWDSHTLPEWCPLEDA